MLEVQGNSVIFYAFYTQDGAGDTGLTVTITVYEITRDGTKTEIVSDAAVTEIGDGLYRYLLAAASVDAAAEYVAVFHTADTDTDQQDMPAMWVIDRANVEDIDDILTDTGTTIPAAVAAVDSDVWGYSSRTLTQSAASVASAVAGSTITVLRGDTLSVSLTNIGALTNYDKIWFTVKDYHTDPDTASIIQIEKTAGLLYINGAAASDPENGSLVVTDEASGDVTINLAAVETAQLSPRSYYYDIQILLDTGVINTLIIGIFDVLPDYTRSIGEQSL